MNEIVNLSIQFLLAGRNLNKDFRDKNKGRKHEVQKKKKKT